jgi:hypothetical protein
LEPFQRDLMCYSGDAVGQGGSIMEKYRLDREESFTTSRLTHHVFWHVWLIDANASAKSRK